MWMKPVCLVHIFVINLDTKNHKKVKLTWSFGVHNLMVQVPDLAYVFTLGARDLGSIHFYCSFVFVFSKTNNILCSHSQCSQWSKHTLE